MPPSAPTAKTVERVATRPALSGLSCLLIVIAAAAAAHLIGLNAYGIIDPGDGYFSEAAREMIERGDYVTPHLNYQIYFSKPIMIYWLIAGAYHLLGVSEVAARLPGALLSVALAASTCYTGMRLFGRRVALFAGLIMASSPLVVTFARLSMVDAPFSAFVGIALCALALTLFAGSRFWWPLIYAGLGLSILTKGPVGLVLVGLGFVLFLAIARPDRDCLFDWLKRLRVGWGMLIILAIVLPWHLAVGAATDWLFPKVFYLYENLGRFKGQTNHEHREPWFYLLTLAYGFAPWVLFLPPAIKQALTARRNSVDWLSAGRPLLFFACFAVAVVGFFTCSVTKLQTYILPAFPALALVVAVMFERCARSREEGGGVSRWLSLPSLILAVLGVLALVGGPVALFTIKHVPVWAMVTGLAASLIAAAGFVAQLVLMRRKQAARALYVLTGTAAITTALVAPVAFHVGYMYRQADLHAVIGSIAGRRAHVAIFQEFKPGVIFYLRQPVDSFFSPDQLMQKTAEERLTMPPQYVIAGSKSMPMLLSAHGGALREICRKGHWAVYEACGLKVQKLPTLEMTFANNLKLDSGRYTWGTLPFAGGPPPWETGGSPPR